MKSLQKLKETWEIEREKERESERESSDSMALIIIIQIIMKKNCPTHGSNRPNPIHMDWVRLGWTPMGWVWFF